MISNKKHMILQSVFEILQYMDSAVITEHKRPLQIERRHPDTKCIVGKLVWFDGVQGHVNTLSDRN